MITGAPGTGKTTIIEALLALKHQCFSEVSRDITLEAREKGIEQLFLTDPLLFSKHLLEKRSQQYSDALNLTTDLIFFDRGVPDVFAYLNFANENYDFDCKLINSENKYTKIFITPPWKEIYTTDNERFESFEQALEIHSHIINTYKQLNYIPITIPTGTVEERINFILSNIE